MDAFFRRSHLTSVLLLFCLLVICNIVPISALRFYLRDRERRCFKMDAPPSSRIVGHKAIDNGKGNADLSIDVRTANGKHVYESSSRDSKHHHFSFTSPAVDKNQEHRHPEDYEDYEDYYDDYDDEYDVVLEICLMLTFDSHVHNAEGKRGVSFWIRAEKESVDLRAEGKATVNTVFGMARTLIEMHNSLQSIAQELSTLRQRERRLVHRHESNAKHIYLLAVLSVIVMIGTSALQFMHFKKYFQTKKLI